jgi:hypothetical protein
LAGESRLESCYLKKLIAAAQKQSLASFEQLSSERTQIVLKVDEALWNRVAQF